MKKILVFIVIPALFLCGCMSDRSQEENSLFVSIAPLKYIVEQIVGDDFDIKVIVPNGTSPETFEPSAKQIAQLNRAKLIFNTGLLDYEKNLIPRLDNSKAVVDLSNGVKLMAGTCSHTHHNGHCNHGIDPHIWCSPAQLLIMADNAFNAIKNMMPDSVKYEVSYTQLCQTLADLDEYTRQECEQSKLGYFIIYHPALTYFARDYDMEQISIENDGKEASVKRIADIIDRAKADKIKKVFYQKEFPRSSVETICDDIGATPVEINPLDENIVENLRYITSQITSNE